MDTSGVGGGSESPSPPSRRSRSRYQSTSQRHRSWSPQSPSSQGGRRSRSRSWSPGASLIRPPIASSSAASPEETITTAAAAAAVEGGEVKKTLYMFFSYASASIDYSLYAINLTIPLIPPPPPPLLQPCNQSTELTSIYPILEFPKGEYPTFMCCVEFESKLYFLGGHVYAALSCPLVNMSTIYPPDVYVLDTTTFSATSTNTATSNRHPSELLKKDSTMNTGKSIPYALVAFRKIYVIGAYGSGGLSQYEVFDLDSSTWTILPQPPSYNMFCSHAVVDRMIFFVTMHKQEIFSFNVDTCEWSSRYSHLVKPFYGRAAFIEDTLYGIYRFPRTIAAYALTTSKSNPEYKAKGLFNRIALLSPDVGYAMEHRSRTTHAGSYLVHLGNRIFSYVSTRKFPCPNDPGDVDLTDPEYEPRWRVPTDPEKVLLSITTMEFLNDTFTGSSIAGVKSFFQAKLLHAAHFAARTKSGVDANTTIRLDCCSMPTSAL